MSHFTTVKTSIKSLTALKTALIRLGIPESAILINEQTPLTLNGWGSQRQKAHLRVKAGNGLNRYDMGWEIQPNGEVLFRYESMESKVKTKEWQTNLLKIYNVEKVKEKIEEEGWELEEEENLVDGSVRLVALVN